MLKFGIEGWRGVIAEEFTFANLERVTANLEAARVFALEVADDDSRLAVSAP